MLVIWEDLFSYKTREVRARTGLGEETEYYDRRWEHSLYVIRPGSRDANDVEKRVARSSGKGPVSDGWAFGAVELFNELGTQGWELITDVPRGTAIRGELLGYVDTSEPIKCAYWFKRAIEAGDHSGTSAAEAEGG